MHLQESFDFLCTSGSEVLQLEVKGTTGDHGPVNVTAGEVTHSREHPQHAAIAIVSGIRVTPDADGKPTASGGTLWLMQPWSALPEELKSTAFRWTPPPSSRRH